MRVFVTGANGWIGSALVPLLQGAGHEVTGLARSDRAAAALSDAGVEVVRGSLDDVDLIAAQAGAADGVVHLAFKHDEVYSGDFPTAIAADLAVVAAYGDALAGSDKPLVVTGGVAGHPSGILVTEQTPATDRTGAGARMQAEDDALALADRGVRSANVRLSPTVHGEGDTGFVAMFVRLAREKGASPWVGDGDNLWPAVHRSDAARLFQLALESAPAGSVLHGVAEEGVPFRLVAQAIGRQLGVPSASLPAEQAEAHFGWLAHFAGGLDVRASSAQTQEVLGWTPTGPTLLEDLDAGRYTG